MRIEDLEHFENFTKVQLHLVPARAGLLPHSELGLDWPRLRLRELFG